MKKEARLQMPRSRHSWRRSPFPTDDAGVFTLPDLAPGSYRFVVSHSKMLATKQAPILIGTTSSPIRLVVHRGGLLTGTVSDQDGRPVAGAEVNYVAQGSVPWRSRKRAITDEQGLFRFSALPTGDADLVASHSAGSSDIVVVPIEPGENPHLKLQLNLVESIDGLVVDEAGQAVPEARVLIKPIWTGTFGERNAWAARGTAPQVADSGGGFRFGGLALGRYRLHAARPGAANGALLRCNGCVRSTIDGHACHAH